MQCHGFIPSPQNGSHSEFLNKNQLVYLYSTLRLNALHFDKLLEISFRKKINSSKCNYSYLPHHDRELDRGYASITPKYHAMYNEILARDTHFSYYLN